MAHNVFNENTQKLCEAIDSAFKNFKDKLNEKFSNSEFNKLYFDLACVLYKHYWNRDLRLNLNAIRKYLQKAIKVDSEKNFQNIQPNQVKQAKYLLQASCDVYFELDEKSDISCIRNPAVVLHTGFLGYNCYYIEDGKWLTNGSNSRVSCSLSTISIDGIKYNRNSKILLRTKDNYRQIDTISLKAQHKRGQLCVNSEYYQLKRKCKKLKKDILNAIKAINEAPQQQSGLQSIWSSVKGYVNSVFKKETKDFTDLMIELIETYLQLGFIDKIDKYLSLFEIMVRENFDLSEIYRDFKYKRDAVEHIEKLLAFHENLINFDSNQNDVQQFVICRSENDEEGKEKVEKIEQKLLTINTDSVLFIRQWNNSWKTALISGNRKKNESTLINSESSLIIKYLNKTTHKRVPNCFQSILIGLINDEKLFDKPIQSRYNKLIEQYEKISGIYGSLGHLPLKERYEKAIKYLQVETSELKQSFITNFGLENIKKDNNVVEEEKEIETRKVRKRIQIGLFNNNSITFIKQLNDKLSENEFFTDTLPKIDTFSDFQSTFNNVYDIDLIVCSNPEEKEKLLEDWKKEYDKLKERIPYHKKYLLVLVECDLIYQDRVDSSTIPSFKNNSIIIERKPDNDGKYSIYFFKNGLWIKKKRTDELKAVKRDKVLFKNDSFIEVLSNKYKLRKWFIYCEQENGRAYQGFLENIETFKPLTECLKEFKLSYLQDQKALNAKKTEILKIIEAKLKATDTKILKPRKDQFIKSSKQNNIQIVNINKPYDQMNLKNKILNNDWFVCIIKFSSNHYIALVSEPKFKENDNWKSHLNIINSNKTNYENIEQRLKWLESNLNSCEYRLNQVKCPDEQPNANNSFLHAYINVSAAKWALENNLWMFLKENLFRQNFSSSRNVEILKKHSINIGVTIPENETLEKNMTKSENFIKFENVFKQFYKMHVNRLKTGKKFYDANLKRIEQLLNIVEQIDSFQSVNEFVDSFEKHETKNQTFEEKRNNLKETLKLIKMENIDIEFVKETIFKAIRVITLEVIDQKNKIIQIFEYFEKKLHEFLLLSIVKNEKSLDFNNNYSSKLKKFIGQNASNNMFNDCKLFFEEALIKCNIDASSGDFNEIKELAQNICNIFNQYDHDDFDEICTSSFDTIKKLITRFYDAEDTLNKLLTFFSDLLPFCFELMDMKEINIQTKRDIYDVIGKPKDNFDDIIECVKNMIKQAKPHTSIKIDAKFLNQDNLAKISLWAYALNEFLNEKDELSIYSIGFFMREKLVQKLEVYLNSLVTFRYESTIAFEKFENELNKNLIKSFKDSELHKKLDQAFKRFTALPNPTYSSMISIYKQVTNDFFKTDSQFNESIENLQRQLDIEHHSHFIYLPQKFKYLKDLIACFYEITKILPNLCEKYSICLADRYDNFTNEEAFNDKTGKLNTEILQKFEKGENFADIKNVLSIFDKRDLKDLIEKVERLIPRENKAALVGVVWCFRETLFNQTKDYANDLLDFRHTAFLCIDKFEKEFFKFLSDYDQLKNVGLRNTMKKHLDNIVSLGEFSKHKRDNFVVTYLSVVNQLNQSNYEWCQQLKQILNECKTRLNPYWNLIANNLRNLLNNYVNWLHIEKMKQQDFVVYQLKTFSAILSEIFESLTTQFNDCFAPNNEIRIINTTNLFVDIDLVGEQYTSMNIVIISPTIRLVGRKTKFVIIVNGNDAKEVWVNSAKNGDRQDKYGNGKPGQDGNDGATGSSGGHVYIVSNELPDIDVFARGGKGSNGQDGGNGAEGKDGDDGKDGSKKSIEDYFKKKLNNSKWNAWAYRVRRIGTDGQSGGHGGDAGAGGYAGEPGEGGCVKLVALNDHYIENYKDKDGEKNNSHGKPGKPG
jgi:hypothetical protein